MRIILSIIIILALSPACALAGPPGPEDGPAPLVTVALVSEQDVNPPIEYVGHVEAIQSVDIRARVEGFIEQVVFAEGDDVHVGDMLYAIEQAPYKAKVDADSAKVAQSEADLAKASQHLKRLHAARVESVRATDMDNAVADEIHAKAQLKEDQALLAGSQLNLSYTTINAPISGRIGRTLFTRGNLVNPASGTLTRIVQLAPIRVVYSISENNLGAIQTAFDESKRGKKSTVLTPRLKLANGKTLKTIGQVDFVDNKVDPATGTIAVWAVFDNADGFLIPGQYVTVLITRSEPKMMPVVPQSAVLVNQQGSYVLVVGDGNTAIARPITTGAAVGTYWGVESGLKAGEKVIVEGIQKVHPGQVVHIAIRQSVER
ncbi:MAG: efflux RND transporter periplasmic adaptor subunit [Pseudomonadota bacterium]